MTVYFLEKAGEQKDDISDDRVFFREGRRTEGRNI